MTRYNQGNVGKTMTDQRNYWYRILKYGEITKQEIYINCDKTPDRNIDIILLSESV